jgi:co-chaperonin GroES (HSP10)
MITPIRNNLVIKAVDTIPKEETKIGSIWVDQKTSANMIEGAGVRRWEVIAVGPECGWIELPDRTMVKKYNFYPGQIIVTSYYAGQKVGSLILGLGKEDDGEYCLVTDREVWGEWTD